LSGAASVDGPLTVEREEDFPDAGFFAAGITEGFPGRPLPPEPDEPRAPRNLFFFATFSASAAGFLWRVALRQR